MRLSRTSWLIVALGVLVIALASLYVVYSRQASQQKELENSLAGAEARFPQLIAERMALESQLAQRQSELAEAELAQSEAEAKFPKSSESIEYDEILFGIADDCHLEVMSLTTSEPRQEKVGDVTYLTTTFHVVVRAADSPPTTVEEFERYIDETVANILDFVHTIATGEDFTNATTELVSMENLEPPDEEEVETAKKPGATISLVIYSYPGK